MRPPRSGNLFRGAETSSVSNQRPHVYTPMLPSGPTVHLALSVCPVISSGSVGRRRDRGVLVWVDARGDAFQVSSLKFQEIPDGHASVTLGIQSWAFLRAWVLGIGHLPSSSCLFPFSSRPINSRARLPLRKRRRRSRGDGRRRDRRTD